MSTKSEMSGEKNGVMFDNTEARGTKSKTLKHNVGNEIFKYCSNSQKCMSDLKFKEKYDIRSMHYLFNYRFIPCSHLNELKKSQNCRQGHMG